MNNPKTKVLRAIAAGSLVTGILFAAPAHAGNTCKDVQLAFENNGSDPINIVDVDYWDPAKGRNGGWRSEPIPNQTISPGSVWRDVRNLEWVNKRETRVRFEYRVPGRYGGWSFTKKHTIETPFVCGDNEDGEFDSVYAKRNYTMEELREKFGDAWKGLPFSPFGKNN